MTGFHFYFTTPESLKITPSEVVKNTKWKIREWRKKED